VLLKKDLRRPAQIVRHILGARPAVSGWLGLLGKALAYGRTLAVAVPWTDRNDRPSPSRAHETFVARIIWGGIDRIRYFPRFLAEFALPVKSAPLNNFRKKS
jgi:hypothetical protein